MATIQFGKLNGAAKKSGNSYMKLVDGANTFRIIGGVLPSYTFWVAGASGNNHPFEALQFDRETEEFDNSRKCPVREAGIKDYKGEDLHCGWSYKCNVINKATGNVEVLQLKKGFFGDIISVAQDLEIDPTDPETGTWLTVTRKKTGPKAFNVEYKLSQLKCKSTPLTEEEKALAATAKPIEEAFTLETYEKQTARLKKHLLGDETIDEATDDEAVSELG